MFVLYDGDALT